MDISFCSHPSTNKMIAPKFGTWHDSWAVVACAKFCCNMITSNWIRAKWIFHRIWIVMEKSWGKWVPRFLSLAQSKLRLCSANHRSGYWGNLPCDWLSTAWAYSEQEIENGPRTWMSNYISGFLCDVRCNYLPIPIFSGYEVEVIRYWN